MTPQNQSLPSRAPERPTKRRRAFQVGVAGVVAVSASIVVPAALAQGDDAPTANAAGTTTVAPAPSTSLAPPTTTTAPTTVPEPVAVPVVEAPAPVPTPEEQAQAHLAAMSPEELAAFRIYTMTDAERAAFVAFISPPPPPAPVVVPQPQPAPAPAPSVPAPAVTDGELWDRLAQCESNGNWHINTGNGYSGGLQFHPGTWNAMGGGQYAPYAYQATREQQIAIAEKVRAAAGGRFSPWPGCRAKLGLP